VVQQNNRLGPLPGPSSIRQLRHLLYRALAVGNPERRSGPSVEKKSPNPSPLSKRPIMYNSPALSWTFTALERTAGRKGPDSLRYPELTGPAGLLPKGCMDCQGCQQAIPWTCLHARTQRHLLWQPMSTMAPSIVLPWRKASTNS
jgi:hypothetical protein